MHKSNALSGGLFAIGAFTLWGIAPIYFKLIDELPALDILMHRILWSMVILMGLMAIGKNWQKVKAAFANKKIMGVLLLSGALLGGNWLLFIWSVNNGHILEASLGYYINPLLNVLLGYVFLQERLTRAQQVAVGLAVTGVLITLIGFGTLPWIALTLAGSFGIYGLLRKRVAVDSLPGLFIETALMLPFAVIYWLWFASPMGKFQGTSLELDLLLLFAGVVTTAPLLCFTAAARRLTLATLGFFQYIGPSLMFVLAVFYYQETVETSRMLTFAFVWGGLAVYTLASLRQYRLRRRSLV